MRIKNDNAFYPLNDHLGTAYMVSDRNGNISDANTYNYTPFGETTDNNPGSKNEQGYTGHIEDPSGLVYMQARYYDPVVGRFIATDPIGYADQLNLYAYVSNDPMNKFDPTGLYGRGSNFSEKEWKKFNKAQQKAAKKFKKKRTSLEKKQQN